MSGRRPAADATLLLLLVLMAVAEVATVQTSEEIACPQCLHTVADKQQATRLKMEAIKRQILSKLSLQERPNITAPPPPREAVLEVLRRSPPKEAPHHHLHPGQAASSGEDGRMTSDETRDDYYARTSEIIAFAEPGSSLNGHVLLDFHQTREQPSAQTSSGHHQPLQQRLRVTGAALWVQLRHVTPLPRRIQNLLRNHTVTLYVFRATASNHTANDTSGDPFNLTLVGSHRASAGHVGWKRIDLSEAVQEWFAAARSRLTLLVDCVGCDSVAELALFADHTTQQQHLRHAHHGQQQDEMTPVVDVRPFLTIATEATRRRRTRRHTLVCNGHTNRCCKQSLYISFRELGWDDWIIAPKGYYANYCVGDCARHPRTPDTFATFHTHVLEEYRSRNPYASIAPCCAPTHLSSMSLIYLDTQMNIFKTDLPKMIVEECGCT